MGGESYRGSQALKEERVGRGRQTGDAGERRAVGRCRERWRVLSAERDGGFQKERWTEGQGLIMVILIETAIKLRKHPPQRKNKKPNGMCDYFVKACAFLCARVCV